MARSGLYKSDVKKARDALTARGTNPSVDAVRVALGNTGSKTTIHKYLKELEEEEGAAGNTKVSISDALQDLVARLAALLHDEADERIAAIRAEFDAKSAEQAAATFSAKQESDRLLSQMRDAESTLKRQDVELKAANEALQRESTARLVAERDVVGLNQRLAENEAHVWSLDEKHEQARAALEHYRHSIKEQRDTDGRRHEQQVQQLQAELRQAQQTVLLKQEENSRLNQDGARLIADLGHARHAHHAEEDKVRRLAQEVQALRLETSKLDQMTLKMSASDIHTGQLQEQLAVAREQEERAIQRARDIEMALIQARATVDAQQSTIVELRSLLLALQPRSS